MGTKGMGIEQTERQQRRVDEKNETGWPQVEGSRNGVRDRGVK